MAAESQVRVIVRLVRRALALVPEAGAAGSTGTVGFVTTSVSMVIVAAESCAYGCQ
jgi:hypothetical protein